MIWSINAANENGNLHVFDTGQLRPGLFVEAGTVRFCNISLGYFNNQTVYHVSDYSVSKCYPQKDGVYMMAEWVEGRGTPYSCS